MVERRSGAINQREIEVVSENVVERGFSWVGDDQRLKERQGRMRRRKVGLNAVPERMGGKTSDAEVR